MKKLPLPPRHAAAGFTLVELLVSTLLITLIMAMLLGTVSNTQRLWQRTTAKAGQFQAARAGFDAMTRRLSQATLNTYWRAYDTNVRSTTVEYQFRRQSELHFLSGPTRRIFTSPNLSELNGPVDLSYPTHGVFFQAPLGHTEYLDATGVLQFRGLDSMLSACGYFIEYGKDPATPEFVRDAGIPERKRFRLMEMTVPAERLSVNQRFNDQPHNTDPQLLDASKNLYLELVDAGGNLSTSWVRPFWMEEALRRDSSENISYFRYARPLAENIIALIILPKKSRADQKQPDAIGELAPEYAFDSWRILKEDRQLGAANAARDNLMPPILQVTLVAIDETSAARVASANEEPPDWTDGLFEKVITEDEYFADLQTLEERLQKDRNRVNYRIFSADVVLRGSKWTPDEYVKN
jgi:uncharacterized protein (TIGR02599 family)